MTTAAAKELVNKQTVTDSRYWDTIWQYSFFMPRMSTFQGSKNRSVRVNKKINTNYLRSVVRKTSSAVGPTTTGGNIYDYGAMLSPHFTYDESGSMYNNLALAVTSRVVDDEYVAKDVYTSALSVAGPDGIGTTSNASGLEVANLVPLDATTGYAKFGISGTVTERFRCRDFTRQQWAQTQLGNPSDPVIPLHDHVVTEGGDGSHHSHEVQSVPIGQGDLGGDHHDDL